MGGTSYRCRFPPEVHGMRTSDNDSEDYGRKKHKGDKESMTENPRYTNLTTLTKRQFYQFRERDFAEENDILRKTMYIVTAVLTIIAFVIFRMKGLSILIFFDALLILILLWINMYGYRFRAIKEFERLQSVRGVNPDITYRFFEEYVQMETDKSTVRINYAQVDKLLETKDLYVLKVGDTGIIIARDGFMRGNRSAFKEFIESRMDSRI